jgi:hypothetical protein
MLQRMRAARVIAAPFIARIPTPARGSPRPHQA